MKDKIYLYELLNIPGLSALKVIAGHNGLKREINTVTLLDAPDGPQWLKGKEFVLTSAYIFDNDYELMEKYILDLIEKDASGLGIKTGRFLDSIPENIAEIATKNRFPIVQIPYLLVWTDIISPFYKLKYGLEDHKNPVVVEPDMILPLFEASRWGGKRLLAQMTELFHIPIALYKQDKTLIINNEIKGVDQLGQAAEGLEIFPDRRTSEKIHVNGFICSFFLLPVGYEREREYLAVASESEEDIEEIKKLLSLIESLSRKDNLALKEKSDVYRIFLHKVIEGTVSPEEISSFEEMMRTKTDLIYTGILIFSSEKYLQLFQCFKEALEIYPKGKGVKAETCLYEHMEKKQAVVLLEVRSSEELNAYLWIRGLIPVLRGVISDSTQGVIGISSIAESLKDIVRLYEQAQKSLQLGRVLWPDQCCHFYPDYSIYELLDHTGLDRTSLDKNYFIDCRLLLENKSTMAFRPLEMAEEYIEHGNYKKAASKLFIHENTLRYRINKINELLHINLENPVEGYRLLSWIKLWKIYKNKKNSIGKL